MNTVSLSNSQLNLNIEINKPFLKIGEEIRLRGSIKNITNKKICIVSFLHFLTFRVYLIGVNGEVSELGSTLMINERPKVILISPGDVYSFNELIYGKGSVYSFRPLEGTYKLFVVYENNLNKIMRRKVWMGKLKSNIIEFAIQ